MACLDLFLRLEEIVGGKSPDTDAGQDIGIPEQNEIACQTTLFHRQKAGDNQSNHADGYAGAYPGGEGAFIGQVSADMSLEGLIRCLFCSADFPTSTDMPHGALLTQEVLDGHARPGGMPIGHADAV